MKLGFDRKINKLLIGAILGTTLIGVTGYSMTPKGKKTAKGIGNRFKGALDFFKLGLNGLKKEFGEKDSPDIKKK